MRDWWNSREANEQRLMMIAAVLVCVVVIMLFIVTPVRAARVDARLDYDASVRSLSIVRSELSHVAITAGPANLPAINADTLRSAATGLALERGLSVSRVQTRGDNVVSVSLDDADPRLVFAWIQDVRVKLGADILRVSMSQGRENTIQAIVDLAGSE